MENYLSWLLVVAVVVALKLAGFLVCTIGIALAFPMMALVTVIAYESLAAPSDTPEE